MFGGLPHTPDSLTYPFPALPFLNLFCSRQMRPSGRSMLKSTSVSGEIYSLERTDGSQSDTALGMLADGSGGSGKTRRSSLSARVVAIVGLPSRRSRSTSQLSQTGKSANKASCYLPCQIRCCRSLLQCQWLWLCHCS